VVLAQRLRYCVFGRRRLRLNDDGGQGRLTTVMIDQHCADHARRGPRKISWTNLEETLAIKSSARIAIVPTRPQSVRETPCTNCDLRHGRRFSMCSRGTSPRLTHPARPPRAQCMLLAFRLQPVPKIAESATGSASPASSCPAGAERGRSRRARSRPRPGRPSIAPCVISAPSFAPAHRERLCCPRRERSVQ
jgi:hypothetical protein